MAIKHCTRHLPIFPWPVGLWTNTGALSGPVHPGGRIQPASQAGAFAPR
ncbi:MAG: hypothetical protein ABI905_05595 [Betaproteobacteria bacterium]